MKTPITPPSAYLDFLKAMSPASGLMSPLPSGTSFKFGEKPLTPSVTSAPARVNREKASPTTSSASETTVSTVTSSVTSVSTVSSPVSEKSDEERPHKPTTKVDVPPPSPFVRPHSARSPRRLHIPQSPFSPARPSPLSARSLHSPYSPFSPAGDWELGNRTPGSAKSVSVRQVVTRTVTYARTPLEPAPKGKRRKLDHE